MNLEKLLNGVNILAVICNQFGDTGKGKFTDFFAHEWADVTARGTGGNNAGHTVIINGKEKTFHLLPAGITYDSEGKITILGNGMVIDPFVLSQELEELEREGGTYKNLMISENAHLILPYHIALDKKKYESLKNGIGSTGRGIGPCYTDKIDRSRGITMGDLKDKTRLSRKLTETLQFYKALGIESIERDELMDRLDPIRTKLSPYIKDTINEIHRLKEAGKKILIEGAQGLLLSVEYGTHPFVTSSDCSINGTAAGVGISAKAIDLVLGIVKFPFMTRVGSGPFPTELGTKSEGYCAEGVEHDIFYEAKTYLGMKINLEEIRELQSKNDLESLAKLEKEREKVVKHINNNNEKVLELCNTGEIDKDVQYEDKDSFKKGIGIRLAALEYGATTARPRRIGWTDAVALKYAVRINSPMKLILSKVDSVSGMDLFLTCYRYENGNATLNFRSDEKFLRGVSAKYQDYKGYKDIEDIRDFNKLPDSLRKSFEDLEKFVKSDIVAISLGPERDQTIIR